MNENAKMIVNIAVILDTHNLCHDVIFNIGATTTTSRSWDIRVTQYDCGQEDSSGSIKYIIRTSLA